MIPRPVGTGGISHHFTDRQGTDSGIVKKHMPGSLRFKE